jgi:hypothetical protein
MQKIKEHIWKYIHSIGFYVSTLVFILMTVWGIVQEDKITQSECQSMNSCLLLLRNVLHIPEDRVLSPSGSAHYSKQNQILWNLFTQSVDKILIQLMTCPQKVGQLFYDVH